MASLHDAILAADDLPREKVPTEEWAPEAPEVWIQGLSGEERDQWEQSLTTTVNGQRIPKPKIKNVRAAFVARVLVDDNGERLFQDGEVNALGRKSAAVLDRLWDVGRRLSGMLTDEELEAQNPSSGDQEEPSPSDSPTPSE